jgi:hypothetical protein
MKIYTQFWLEKLKGRHHSEDPDVNGSVILKQTKEFWCDGVDWIHLVQCRDRWQTIVIMVV